MVAVETDIVVNSDLWQAFMQDNGAQVIEKAVHAAVAAVPFVRTAVEVCICLDTNAAVQKLNLQFAGRDKPTNVLSFGAFDDDEVQAIVAQAHDEPLHIGDIILAYETCVEQATSIGRTMHMHISHLVVHGVLHVLGFDHQLPDDATLSEHTERTIMAGLGFDDPYPDAEKYQF